ncbi:MAG TPA: M42 family metallopeptidase [Candidatus Limnocylindrales bacterium]|nr:M42 family metallopeptidase [Candidatus Limnocylindrales bacterium]
MLTELSNLRGVSGDEGAVRQVIAGYLKDSTAKMTTDTMGNLLVRKGEVVGKPRIMLSAHMDEVGLMVMAIEKSGYLKFKPVGGIDTRVLVAKRLRVGAKGLLGVIGSKAIHLQKMGEQKKPYDEETLYIDCGFKSREEAEKHVKTGDYVTFDSSCVALGDGFYRGKAFDDRVGCAVLLELLLEQNSLVFDAAFTVQEEIGTRGASVAAYTLKPQVALVVEATAAGDTPDTAKEAVSTNLGQGPAISIMDRSILVDRKVRQQLVEAATAAAVPYQFRRFTGAATEAGTIALSREGVKTGVVAVPCRYIHSPHNILQESDLKATVSLIRAWLEAQQ